jgi:hypothetical protein
MTWNVDSQQFEMNSDFMEELASLMLSECNLALFLGNQDAADNYEEAAAAHLSIAKHGLA